MSEIDDGSASQNPAFNSAEDGNLLNYNSSTTSNANFNVDFDTNSNNTCSNSNRTQKCDLKQDLETKTDSFPLFISSSQINLEDMKTDMLDKPTAVKTPNCSEKTEDNYESNLNNAVIIENDRVTFEKEVPEVISSQILNLHSNIIQLKEKLIEANSEDECTIEKQTTDETSIQVESFQLPDICKNLCRDKDRTNNSTAQEEETCETNTDKAMNVTAQEENCDTKTDKIINSTVQEENYDKKTDKTVKTINITASEKANYNTIADKTVNSNAPKKENYNRTDKAANSTVLEKNNSKTDNKVNYSGNCNGSSAEGRSQGTEVQALKSVSDGLRNLKISDRLENTCMNQEMSANQKLKKTDDSIDLNFHKNQSNVNNESNRKVETTSQTVNQTYLNALKYIQSLCDQPESTMLGRKSEAYFQIRSQENKCVELGTELQNLKRYLGGVKSDIVDLKVRCLQIQTSLKDISDK